MNLYFCFCILSRVALILTHLLSYEQHRPYEKYFFSCYGVCAVAVAAVVADLRAHWLGGCSSGVVFHLAGHAPKIP
jgi:hypothetical protein